MLARLSRAGGLTAVRVLGTADEAVRDLVRASEDAVREQRNARHRLKALLLRNGQPNAGKTAWTPAHRRWLSRVKLAHEAQQIGLQEYLHAITESSARIARLEQAMRQTLAQWSLATAAVAGRLDRGVGRSRYAEPLTHPAQAQFDQRYQSHLRHLRLKGMRPKTVEAYARAIRRLGEHFDHRIDDLSPDELSGYFDELLDSHSWSSVKHDLYGDRSKRFSRPRRLQPRRL